MDKRYADTPAEKPCGFRKCGIIGCGNVGATTAYTLMQTGWFSEMVLIDLNAKKAEGEAADLRHGLPFHTPMNIHAGGYQDLVDCGIIIITAGANQKPGETRMDLLRTNTKIFRSIVNNIVIYNRQAILRLWKEHQEQDTSDVSSRGPTF